MNLEIGTKLINPEMYPQGWYGIVSKVEDFGAVVSVTLTIYNPEGETVPGINSISSSEEGLRSIGWKVAHDICHWCGAENGYTSTEGEYISLRQGWDCYNCLCN